MKTLATGAAVADDTLLRRPWPPERWGSPKEQAERSLRSIATELAKTATECSPSELPAVLAELAAAQAVALQRIVNEKTAREEEDRPLSWLEAAAMSGGLQLTEDWLKKNRHKLPFAVQVSRKKWYISEKGFRRWLETRKRA